MGSSFEELLEMQKELMSKIPHGHMIKSEHQANVVASLGLIEETMEYLNAIGFKTWRPNPLPEEDQLEEITDVLFFYLEMVISSGFSWERIVQQYHKKHAINMQRYKDAAAGNYEWDRRRERKGL